MNIVDRLMRIADRVHANDKSVLHLAAQLLEEPDMKKTRPCPVDGCDGTVKPGKILCPLCWAKVPRELRSFVWSACRKATVFPSQMTPVVDKIKRERRL